MGSNPIWGSEFFYVLLWSILYISLYFLYDSNIRPNNDNDNDNDNGNGNDNDNDSDNDNNNNNNNNNNKCPLSYTSCVILLCEYLFTNLTMESAGI